MPVRCIWSRFSVPEFLSYDITYEPVNFVIRRTSVPKNFRIWNFLQKKSRFLEYTKLLRRNYCSNVFFQSTKSTIPKNRDNKLSIKKTSKNDVINCTWYTATYSLHQGFDILFTYLQSPGNPVVRCPYDWRYCCIFSYTPRFRL